jgi:murein DD-endopeptidase MepM/ murein hydrolase activator NlpD
MISPYKGNFRVSQSWNNLRSNGTLHQGFDLVGIGDKCLYSPVYGTVVRAGWENPKNTKQGWGRRVVIRIGKTRLYMYFGHLSSIAVRTGQAVAPGDLIGIEGSTGHSTGSHLHWEIRESDRHNLYRDMPQYSSIPNEASRTAKQSSWDGKLLGTATLFAGRNGYPASIYNSILQARLSALGFDAGDPDGLFGNKTTQAVKQFQLSRSLEADGRVGAKTKAQLFAL